MDKANLTAKNVIQAWLAHGTPDNSLPSQCSDIIRAHDEELVRPLREALVYFADKGWGVRVNKPMQRQLDNARDALSAYQPKESE